MRLRAFSFLPAAALLALVACAGPDPGKDGPADDTGTDENGQNGTNDKDKDKDDEDCELLSIVSEGGDWSGCYLVEGMVAVIDAVTMAPGTELRFLEAAGLDFQGNVRIEGTKEDPVIFRGTEDVPGWWRGLLVRTDSITNTMAWAQITGAGHSPVPGADAESALWISGRLEVSDTRIEGNDGYGLVAFDGLRSLERSVLTENTWPLFIHLAAAEVLGDENSFAGNSEDRVHLGQGQVSSDVVLPNIDVPYFSRGIDASGDFTVEAGVEVIFAENSRARFRDGIFRVEGTEAEPVLFRGEVPGPGSWDGVGVQSDRVANRVDWLTIQGGGHTHIGSGNPQAGLMIGAPLTSATLSIHNSTFRENEGHGIALYPGSGASVAFTGFTGNRFDGNTGSAILLGAYQIGGIEGPVELTDNGRDAIEVAGGVINSDLLWRAVEGPWFLSDEVRIAGGHTTIEPGAVLSFDENTFLRVDGARLSAVGTPDDPIVMQGSEPVSGWWRGLHIADSAGGPTLLEHLELKHAGRGALSSWFDPAGIAIGQPLHEAHVELRHSHIHTIGSSTYGEARGIHRHPNSTVNADVCTINTFEAIAGPIDCEP